MCQLSIYNSFPVIRTATAKKSPFSRTAAHIFVSPEDAPAIMTQNVVSMERQFNAFQTPRSMYLSIFNSFRVIRCLNQCVSPKIAIFTTFLFPLGTPGAITLNVVWTEIQFDAYKLSRSMCPSNYNRFWDRAIYCMYPSVFKSFPVIQTATAKNRHFHVQQPTFLFPLKTPLRLWRKMLYRWKDNSMLSKLLAACTYLSSIVSELYDA